MAIAPAPVFVGRQMELRALHAAFADASAGRSQVLLVESEPGIGKTTLLERFLAELPPTLTMRASGDESESDVPFAMADQLQRSAGGDSKALRADGHVAVGLDLLERINSGPAEDRPSVVVVDDAHLTDADRHDGQHERPSDHDRRAGRRLRHGGAAAGRRSTRLGSQLKFKPAVRRTDTRRCAHMTHASRT